MLTELFLLGRPSLAGVADYLRERSRLFGEGLQLVNILKDVGRRTHARGGSTSPAAQRGRDRAGRGRICKRRPSTRSPCRPRGPSAAWWRSTRSSCASRAGRSRPSASERPGAKLSRVEVFAIVAGVLGDVDDGRPALPRRGLGCPTFRPRSERSVGAGLLPVLVACSRRGAGRSRPRARDQVLPAADVHDGPQRGEHLRLHAGVPAHGEQDRILSITAPSVSWNSSAGVTGTYRYYRYFDPARLLARHRLGAAPTSTARLWFQYDDDRRDERQSTKNVMVRVRRNLFYRYFGLGPDTTAAGESSYTRVTGTRERALGLEPHPQLQRRRPSSSCAAIKPEVHAISGLPETQVRLPRRARARGRGVRPPGVEPSATTRARGATTRCPDSRSELSASLAEGHHRASACSDSSSGTPACWCPRPRSCSWARASTGGS